MSESVGIEKTSSDEFLLARNYSYISVILERAI